MGMLTDGYARPTVECDPLKGAKQSFKEECDINNIVRKYQATGMVTHVEANAGVYADVSGATDFRSALDRVKAANKVFMGLDPETRGALNNSPAEFLDLLADPSRRSEMEELGLLPLVEAVEDPPDPVIPPVEPEVDPS